MSYTSEVTIQGAPQRDIDKLNRWLKENDPRPQRFQEISIEDQAGGTQPFCSDTYACAFNYMNFDLVDLLSSPDTWSSSGIRWTIDTQGEAYTIGLYVAPNMLVMKTNTYTDRVTLHKNGVELLNEVD